jgi:hypothetical protein
VSKVSFIVLSLLLCLVVTANVNCMRCGQSVSQKMAESAIKAATGGKATVDLGGNVDMSDLPATLRYPGAAAKAKWTMNGEHGSGTVYTLETGDAPATVVTFYKSAFSGWKQSAISESGDATVLIYGNDATKEWASVSVSKGSEGKTTIAVTYYKGQ